MDDEAVEPAGGPKALRDLDPMSFEDLEDYISELEAEIERVKGEIAKKKRHRDGVEGLFKRD